MVRGGRKLLHTRLHLEQAGLDEEQWRRRWCEVRTRIEADGESGKRHGNQSIQITPDGAITIKLPPEPAARYAPWCDAHGRYPLDARCAVCGVRSPTATVSGGPRYAPTARSAIGSASRTGAVI